MLLSLPDLQKEVGSLRASLKETQKELEYQQKNPSGELGDSFVDYMEDFIKTSADSFAQLEGMMIEMKERVGEVTVVEVTVVR